MQSLRISNATRVLAETQDEYHALAILDERINGYPCMTSVWEPNPKELEELTGGGAVRLTIMGTKHPPVILSTQPAPGEPEQPRREDMVTRAEAERMAREREEIFAGRMLGCLPLKDIVKAGMTVGETLEAIKAKLAQAPAKAQIRCAECDCDAGGDDCNWIAPHDQKREPRPIDEWHEDMGDVLWWCWRDGAWLEEAPYIGSPLDLGQTIECHTHAETGDTPAARFNVGGWPGYHTHWTPLPAQPYAPSPAGDGEADG